jgi:alpha-D-ribose 1-methylphosphonate 5-triphosphate synthase subunit PhnH
MKPDELSKMSAGFSNEAFGSQAVFRVVLTALSEPGQWREVSSDAPAPEQGQSAAAAVLLALLDPDCVLWVSPEFTKGSAPAWLRFHTGCRLTNVPHEANFLWFHALDSLLPFTEFALGSDEYPDQSATVLIDVMPKQNATLNIPALTLTGPGIKEAVHVVLSEQIDISEEKFNGLIASLQSNQVNFPRGADTLLCAGTRILGLPRTTCLRKSEEF